jgi:hypothetical protein
LLGCSAEQPATVDTASATPGRYLIGDKVVARAPPRKGVSRQDK